MEMKFLVEENVYAVVCKPQKYIYVSIREYWTPKNTQLLLPTRRGVHIPKNEFFSFLNEIDNIILSMDTTVSQYYHFGYGYVGIAQQDGQFVLRNGGKEQEICLNKQQLLKIKSLMVVLEIEINKFQEDEG